VTGSAAAIRTMSATCFYEANPALSLLRRGLVEGVGTLLLMFIITASHAPLAGAAALAALVMAFGAVSGGHYNPLITALQWLGRERTTRCTLTYIAAQIAGALLGASLAGAVLGLHRVVAASQERGGWAPEEFVATAGLMVIVFGCARSARAETGPFAVGTWLVAVALTLPGAYMNPALTLGALLATGPVALSTQGILSHVPSQCAGALLAFGIIRAAYEPGTATNRSSAKP
jgi:glycerol uptake facilitator-like aquaporin